MTLSILYHGHCFDGLASAALFATLYRQVGADPQAQPRYVPMAHGSQQEIAETSFGPGDNAIVDFKYSTSPSLTWWFDHHQSAFAAPEMPAHFESTRGDRKFFDPAYSSCAKLIADVGAARFGMDWTAQRELIDWADTIDAARYPSVEEALSLEPAAQRLRVVIEGTGVPRVTALLLAEIAARPLDEVIALPEVASAYDKLIVGHRRHSELFRGAMRLEKRVGVYDLVGQDVSGHNKFLPYRFCPDAVYVVGVSTLQGKVKISVGYSPWTSEPRNHNIASICERYGGGGHPVVGAMSFPSADIARARQVAQHVVAELNGDPGAEAAA